MATFGSYHGSRIPSGGMDLAVDEVNDIIDRLHVGTLRREALKERTPLNGYIEITASVSGVSDHQDDEIQHSDSERSSKKHKKHRSKTSRGSSGSSESHSSLYEPMVEEPPSPNWRGPSLLDALTPIKDLKLSPMEKLKRLFKKISPSSEKEPDELKFPQYFLTKYMGKRSTKGLWGAKHTRRHVETLVDKVGELTKGDDLPLVTIEVSLTGLRMAPHKRNKVSTFTTAFIPIEYISYGVQDSVYPRLFSFIMVKEMSSVKRRLECHIYACDTVMSSRKLATALAVAFQAYSDSLQGAPCKFSVEVKNRDDDTMSSYDA